MLYTTLDKHRANLFTLYIYSIYIYSIYTESGGWAEKTAKLIITREAS